MADYLERHLRAMMTPDEVEQPMVWLAQSINRLSQQYAHDMVMRGGVAQLILGMIRLLDTDLGRLDQGELDRAARRFADRIGFDLDVEEFWPPDQVAARREMAEVDAPTHRRFEA